MSHLNAQIVRLYDTVFDRAPDAEGLEFWNNATHINFGLRDLANFFIAAPEFAATYGEPTTRGFVEAMYRNVLDRPGEAEGIAFWTNALDQGLADRPQVVVGFSESAEHIQQMEQTTYRFKLPTTEPNPLPPPFEGRKIPMFGTHGDDVMRGGPGPDMFDGLTGHDVIHGEEGNDVLIGEIGYDSLFGGAGHDGLSGGPGDDWLVGGPGNDLMSGGPGVDIFVIRPGDGHDTISDFRQHEDRILFEGITRSDISFVSTPYDDFVKIGYLKGSDAYGTIQLNGWNDKGIRYLHENFLFA